MGKIPKIISALRIISRNISPGNTHKVSPVEKNSIMSLFRPFITLPDQFKLPVDSKSSRTAERNVNFAVDPFSLVSDELSLLGQRMRNMVVTEIPKLATAAEYFFKTGMMGKRIRPAVLLLMASSLPDSKHSNIANFDELNGLIREKQQRLAEIIEMIHVASLLHDDVLDHSDSRRGVDSLNRVMGNKLAVLAGDFLLARASAVLASLKNTEVVELISKVLEDLVAGEIMQITAVPEQSRSMEYYLKKNFCKTASLMAYSCKAVAILGDHSPQVADLAFQYGRHLGQSFQLIDDALDFTGTLVSLGKPSLSDLKSGLATAPVLFAAEKFDDMIVLIERKFSVPGDVEKAHSLVKKSDGIERTHLLARDHAMMAREAIHSLPPSDSASVMNNRDALISITEMVLTRTR